MLSVSQNRRIEWGDCDPAGIVFNPRYFAFFDHNTTMLYEAAGWPKPVMLKEFNALGCPLVETRARFVAPCTFGDDVTITSTVADVRRSSFDIKHELWKGETLCVEGFETRVWTVRDPGTGNITSAPLPEKIKARFNGKD